MKILASDKNRLEIGLEISKIRKIISGIFILSALVFIIFAGLQYSSLECTRESTVSGSCKLSKSSILGKSTTNIPLSCIKSAEIVSQYPGRMTIIHITPVDKTSFTYFPGIFDRSLQEETVKKINDYIQNKQQTSLNVEQDERLAGFMLGTFGLLAAFMILRQYIIKFDKTLKLFTIEKKNLLGMTSTAIKYELYKIKEVTLESTKIRKKEISQIKLILNDGNIIKLPLLLYAQSSEKDKLFELIKTFLNTGSQ